MISKQSKNSGASGGNGMQSFSVDYLIDCDTYHDYKKGHTAHCSHCGEDYHLEPTHTYLESLKLTMTMKKDGCPFCNQREKLTNEHLEWFKENNGKFLRLDFEIHGGKFIQTYRKPFGWKPINKTQLRDAWEDKQAA